MAEDVSLDYEAFLKALGRRIKEFRKERKLSLHDMVVKHGYHDSQWRRFEREGAANMSSLLKIARSFETTLSILLDGLGEFPSAAVVELQKKQSLQKRSTAKRTSRKGQTHE